MSERSGGRPLLLLMKGPPGSGKSTIAAEVGRALGWPVIDKDDVRDLLPDAIGGISYDAMLAIARRQLHLGMSVIADSPLGYARSYRAALETAADAGARVAVVECLCSDQSEWKRRIDAREGLRLASHHATNWQRVADFAARSAGDPFSVDVPRLVVDTAGSDVKVTAASVVDWISALQGQWERG